MPMTLQSLFNAIDESVCFFDRNGLVLAVNDTFAERVGRSVADCVGQSIYSFIPPEVAAARRVFVETVLRTRQPLTFEDERYGRWQHHRVCPILGADGTVEQLAGFARDITDRKQSEIDLANSEAKFKAIANYTVNWESWFGPDGKYLWVNPAVKRLTGYTPEEILALPDFITTLIAPEDHAAFLKKFKGALQGISGEGFEFRILRKNGTQRWISAAWQSIFDDTGHSLGVRASGQDITDHKQADELLRTMADMLDLAPNSITIHDFEGRFLYVNRKTLDLHGYTADEFQTLSLQDLDVPESAQQIEPRMQFLAEQGEATFEVAHFKKDRSIVFLEIFSKKVLWAGIPALMSIATDITERKRAEQFRNLTQVILAILNAPLPMEDAFRRIIEIIRQETATDAVGLRLQHADDYPYFVQKGFPADFISTENSLAARNPQRGLCRDENGQIALECTCGLVISGKTDPAHPFFTPGGSCWINNTHPLLELPQNQDPRFHPRNRCVLAGYGSLALIPIRAKQNIVGLLQLNAHRINAFTLDTLHALEGIAPHIGEAFLRIRAEKHQEQLQIELAQARKLESVGRLAGGVAHDFNNLIMGIMGYTELSRDALEPNHPIRPWLDEITSGAQRSANLTRQLLAFARQQIIAPEVLDINSTIAGMLKLLKRLLREDINLVWNPGPESLRVKMDPSQLDQILVNLAVNARDAMPGVGQFTLETRETNLEPTLIAEAEDSPIGPFLQLTVSDTGRGMDAETLEHIFEPFFTTKRLGEGTGLGLATVYGIVKQNKGFIAVSSRPLEGTTFRLYLPLHTADEGATPSLTPLQESPRGQETILLVEDEDAVRLTVELFLKTLGYSVLVAATPQEALRFKTEYPGRIHLLITDVIMPIMSGRDLAQQLIEQHPEIKCLYMSGYPSDIIARQGVLDPNVAFIAKPFSREILAFKIRETLDH